MKSQLAMHDDPQMLLSFKASALLNARFCVAASHYHARSGHRCPTMAPPLYRVRVQDLVVQGVGLRRYDVVCAYWILFSKAVSVFSGCCA